MILQNGDDEIQTIVINNILETRCNLTNWLCVTTDRPIEYINGEWQ